MMIIKQWLCDLQQGDCLTKKIRFWISDTKALPRSEITTNVGTLIYLHSNYENIARSTLAPEWARLLDNGGVSFTLPTYTHI